MPKRGTENPNAELRAALHPFRQPAAILLQQKGSYAKAFADDAVRLGIAGGARNPLLPHAVLRGRKPFLRQYLYQSRLGIENKERKRRIVVRHRLVARCFLSPGGIGRGIAAEMVYV